MAKRRKKLVGVGLYSVPLASRLARVQLATIHRWLFGYARPYKGEVRRYPPLWKSTLDKVRGVGALSFEDLMELRVIGQFLAVGVSIHKVREAALVAKDAFGVDHPFSTRLFATDGWNVIASLPHTPGATEKGFLDVIKHQWMFADVVRPSLLVLDYPDNDPKAAPTRWWPDGRDSEVVLDPQRSFGHPIVTNAGVRTSVLAGMAQKNTLTAVADWFGVTRRATKDATRFEDRLAA